MRFKPGDKVRCIDASLSSYQLKCGDVYQVFEPDGDFRVSIYGTVGSWEIDRFEKVDKPESVANAPGAAAAESPATWPIVICDMAERNRIGTAKYGRPLTPHNGRDTLRDAYEEALDLAVYLRTAIYERDGK